MPGVERRGAGQSNATTRSGRSLGGRPHLRVGDSYAHSLRLRSQPRAQRHRTLCSRRRSGLQRSGFGNRWSSTVRWRQLFDPPVRREVPAPSTAFSFPPTTRSRRDVSTMDGYWRASKHVPAVLAHNRDHLPCFERQLPLLAFIVIVQGATEANDVAACCCMLLFSHLFPALIHPRTHSGALLPGTAMYID